ncbi:response regulator [Persephonella sp.]
MIEEKKATILVVDDDPQNRMLLRFLCKKWGYTVLECKNGIEALNVATQHTPDVILMDVMMPEMDGFSVTEKLKNDEKTKYIPIIIITALEDRESRIRGIENGADEFLTKPIDAHELKLRLRNTLKLKQYNDFLKNYNLRLEKEVKKKTYEIKKAYIESLYRLARLAEYKDMETGEHLKRIGYFSKEIALRLGLGRDFAENIYHASQMHDIGKVGIPENILQKPGSLSKDEFKVMEKHTIIGADILKGSTIPLLQIAEKIAKFHHEKWNGEGYPFRLKEEEIPLSARIVTISDVYDALRSKRTYKPPMSHEDAKDLILYGKNRTKPEHFDPEILNIFRKYHKVFEEIYETYRDL